MLAYSVVIPVYNAEKYLESSVQSVLQQKTGFEYEIILVNDGSRDHSAALCDKLAMQDARIHVIHQVNQGVSAARNAGIAAAKGAYVLFLDSDDQWAEDTLQTLGQVLADEPDLVEFGYTKFTDTRVLETVLPDSGFTAGSGAAYFETYAKKLTMPVISCWAAAFRRQFLLDHGLRFPVGVTYGEDYHFHMHCLKRAESVVSISQPLYLYRINEESVTHTPTLKRASDNIASCAQMYRLFPCEMLADYYCRSILILANFSRKDAAELKGFLRENRDILRHVSKGKSRLICMLYQVFGWRDASRLVRFCVELRHSLK